MFNNNKKLNEVNALSAIDLAIIDYIALHSNKYEISCPSQDKIAKNAGCSREWVCKRTTYLYRKGFLVKLYRHLTSSIYILSLTYFSRSMRDKLKHKMPALACLGFAIGNLLGTKLQGSSLNLTKDYINSMKQDKISELTAAMQLTPDQRRSLSAYPAHILDHAWQKTLKNTHLMRFASQRTKFNYFAKICGGELGKKSRVYDPLTAATIEKLVANPTPVPKQNPSKQTTGPVVNPEIPTSVSTPPPVLQSKPTATTESKDNSHSVEDIMRFVADNFGIESMEVTENGRTTKSVLSDKGIVSKGSMLPVKRSPADVRKVQWTDSVTARVTSREESGLAAMAMFAQDMIKSAPVAEKAIVDESIHQPKHATVDDLIADSMKPHIQVDGAVIDVISADDGWWATQQEPVDIDEWLF